MKIMTNDEYNKIQRGIEARDDLINTQKEMIDNLKESNDVLKKMVNTQKEMIDNLKESNDVLKKMVNINYSTAVIIKLYKEQTEIMTAKIEELKKALANNNNRSNNNNHHKKHNNCHKNANHNNNSNDVKE